MRGCYPPKAWLHFLFVVAVAALCWPGFAAAQEGPIGTKAYPCLTAEAKDELDQLDREISNIESNLPRYGDDEETVRDAIKRGQTDSIDQFTYMRHFGHDGPTLGVTNSPQELLEQIVTKIQVYKDRLEQLKKRRDDLSGLPRCPPEPDKATAPPPPVTPPKATPVPVTPPVAATPKPVVKVCPKCRSIADQIADIDGKIAGWERQVLSLHKSNLNDPGIQNALKDIARTIADLKATRAKLEAKKTECEKTCKEKKTERKNETVKTVTPSTGTGQAEKRPRKEVKNKTTKRRRAKINNDQSTSSGGVSPETAHAIGTIIDIGVGVGLRRSRGHTGGHDNRGDAPKRVAPKSDR
jgi:hypothetical protein